MANDENIRVRVTGDTTQLKAALGDAEKNLDKFGKKVGGSLGGLSSDVGATLGKIGTGVGGIAAVSLTAATAVTGLILKTNDLVRELNQLSKQSGLSVTELQKLEKAFRATGFGVDKFVDINQDALDKLSDAYRNGGGIADDMISVGLDPKKYSKFLNDKDGGIKAVIQAYYDLKKAGASVGDQKFFLESWVSDGSRLTGVLDESKDAAEAWNKIAEQTVSVTEDQAKVYAQFDKHLSDLKTTSQDYLFKGLTPIVEATNNMLDAYSKEAPDTFFDSLKDKALATYDVIKYLNPNYYIGRAVSAGLDATGLFPDNTPKPKAPQVNPNLPLGQATVVPNSEAEDPFKLKEKQEKAAEQARKAAEAAAKAQKAIADKAAKERIDAQKALDKVLSDQTVGENQRQLAEFKRQQDEIVATIKKSAKTLGLSDAKLKEILNDQMVAGAAKRLEMTNSMIGYTDPNQGLKDTNTLIGSGALNDNQKGYLANQQNQRISGSNPFSDAATANTKQQLADNNEALQLELKQNDLLLAGHEDYEKRKAEITAKYNAQAIDIENQNAQTQLQIFGDTADSLANGMAAAFGQSSAAAQVAFGISKGITMAQTVLSIQSALAQALATPFPASLANYAQIASLGMSIISTAKGASSGQFHGGIDSVPASYDNKSFMLKNGERIVQPEANKKLTAFLDNQSNNSSSSGDGITIYSPLIVKGNVDDPETWNKMMKKNQNNVAQAVRSSQKRNT